MRRPPVIIFNTSSAIFDPVGLELKASSMMVTPPGVRFHIQAVFHLLDVIDGIADFFNRNFKP